MTTTPESAISFYDSLAPLFDVMTDWNARLAAEGPFLQQMLSEAGARRVLDAACGSGGHALALAGWGFEAAGADASPVMVEMARGKAQEAGLSVPFWVADLADLPSGRPELPWAGRPADAASQHSLHTRFDAVLCLGNSLPHLLSQADLVSALRGMAAELEPGGLLVLQNLNYDLRWAKQPRFFAAQGGVLEGQEVLVWRFADYDETPEGGRIAFHIALFRKGAADWKVEVHTTPQRPLFRADLLAALSEAGFGVIRAFGRMALGPDGRTEDFEPEHSGDLVVTARKTG